MNRFVLHLGHIKTGSTGLQELLTQREHELGQLGLARLPGFVSQSGNEWPIWLWPEAPWEPAHDEFGLSGSSDTQFFAARLGRAVKKSAGNGRPRVWIASNENLAHRVTRAEEVFRIKELVAPLKSTFEVVLYARRLSELVPSWYGEAVLSGRTEALELTEIQPGNSIFDFAAMCKPWLEAGVDRLWVRPYSRKGVPIDTRVDFLTICGVPPTVAMRLAARHPGAPRRHLGSQEIEILRAMNSHISAWDLGQAEVRGRLVSLLRRVSDVRPSTRLALSSQEIRLLGQRFREAHEELSEIDAGVARYLREDEDQDDNAPDSTVSSSASFESWERLLLEVLRQ